MAEKKQCAHPGCNCQVADGGLYGNYCSAHCKAAGKDVVELVCECGHPECR